MEACRTALPAQDRDSPPAPEHSDEREPGNDLRALPRNSMVAQVTRQRDANERVRHDEAIRRERAHPAVNVQAACAASGQYGNGKHGGDSGGKHGDLGVSLRAWVVRNEPCASPLCAISSKHARRRGNAAQRSGEHAHHRADINQQSKHRHRPTSARTCMGAWLIPNPGRQRESPELRCMRRG